MRPKACLRIWLVSFALACFLPVSGPAGAEALTVGGTVLDQDGKPLAKATVELLPLPTSYERSLLLLQGKTGPEPVATAASDAAGRFRITAPAPGLWRVRVQARGFVPREHTSPLLEETELREARLEPATAVKVQVADAQGKPVVGARVLATPDFSPSFRTRNLFDPWRAGERFGVTEPDGSVTFLKEAAETLKLEAGAPGQTTAEASVPVDAQRALGTPVWIRPTLSAAACTVTVELADRERKPVAGALVSLDRLNLASTDAAGRATLPAPCGKEAAIRASLADGRRAAATLGAKRVQGEPFRLAVPPQPVRLSGRALEDGSRQPIAGAFVWSPADPGRAVQTGRDGGYTLTVAPGEKAMLLAASVQHVEGRAEHDAPAEGGTHPGPSFALSPTALAAGTVVDEAGRPVAGAQIQAVAGTFRMSTAGRGQQTRSGDRGAFRLRVSSGQAYDLKVTSTGFAPASVPLPEMAPRAARQDLRIVLQRGRKATGTVLDAQERPVAGARLVLRPGRSPERMPSFPFGGPGDAFEATSGADGRFAFEHLTPGRFDLRAQAAGFGPVVVPGLEVRADAESTSLGTVILQPGVELAGVVADNKDRPIAGARVETRPDGMRFAPGFDDDRMETTTAADGSFVFSGLGTGSRRAVEVSGEGYASRNLSGVELPLAQPLKIVLAPGSRIAGRAVDERGQPVQQALVQVTKTGTGANLGGRSFSLPVGTAVTDELGRFEVKNLEAGNLTLRAEADGKRPTEMANLELTAGKDLENLEVVLRAGAVVTGQVLGPDGKPVAGARIDAEGEDRFRMPTMSDGDGKYRFGGLEPGPRVLSAEHSDYQRVARNLDVQPGENRLDFHLGGGHTVAGRVIDFAGQPVEGATLALQSPDWRSQSQARSGADGSFQIANVGAGLYTLSAERQGYASARVPEIRVAGPVSGLEVRLDRGGTIRGRLLGVDFSALSQVTIMARQTGGAFARGQADFRGEYRVDGVAGGEWQVTAFLAQDGRRAEGKVLVEAGAEAVLDLDFDDKGGLTLSGRVLYRGEPRDGLRVYAQGTDSRSGGVGQTNQDGAFRISGLDPGAYNVSLMSFGTGVSHQQTVELTADREIVIELPESRLSGQVVDAADSSAVEGATVTLEPLQPAPDTGSSMVGPRSARSDTSGAFTLSDVGEGSYRVVARKEGYGPAESTVQVAPGAAVEGIRLALSSTQGLTLQVSSPAGSPREVQLALLEGSGRVVLAGSYPVAEGGRVRLSDAPPGRWSLLVSSLGTGTASLEVSVPGPPVPVALPPTVQLLVSIPDLVDSSLRATLTVQGANGRPYQAIEWGGTVRSQWPAYEGRSQLELPPGNWKVAVAAPDGRTWQGTALIVPGTPGELTLR